MKTTDDSIIQKNKDIYNRIAAHFSDTRREVWNTFVPLAEYAKSGDRILDLGCGNGRLYQLFEKDKEKKLTYVGVDFSEELLKSAHERHPSIEFRLGDLREIPAQNEEFDIVYCLAAFHHLPTDEDRARSLREVARVLKSGGYFIMTNWNLYADWAKQKVAAGEYKIGEKSDEYIVPWKNPEGKVMGDRYYYSFTPEQLEHYLGEAGFMVEKQYYDKAWWAKSEKDGQNIVTITKKG